MSKERKGAHFATPTGASENNTGYLPVTSEGQTSDRRRGTVLEEDPYDLKGYRGKKHGKRSRVISNVLFVVGIALLLVAGFMWGRSQLEYAQQDEIIEELQGYATVDDEGNNPPEVDWAALKAVNDDVVGWVQMPGTVVNYPVYQGATNDTYLHSDAEGNYSLGGLVFMDYENIAPGMVDAQTIIYGHHLRNGAMFKPIADMDNQEMFDSVHTVWYVTEEADYELEPLCVYYATEDELDVRTFDFESDEERQAYFAGLVEKAVTKSADAEQVAAGARHVLTLVTCNYIEEGTTGRTVLVCVPKSEAEAVRNGTPAETEGEADAAAEAEAEA